MSQNDYLEKVSKMTKEELSDVLLNEQNAHLSESNRIAEKTRKQEKRAMIINTIQHHQE